MKTTSILAVLVFLGLFPVFSQIEDIKVFLDECPTNDPAIETILNDFEFRVNGELVTEFPCSEPVTQLDLQTYNDPLIYLQTLRVAYYMDRHMQDHLPWTDTTLYAWLKESIDGINFVEGTSGGYCCSWIDGKKFMVAGISDDFNREFDKTWTGISSNLAFVAHEARHTDDEDPGHTSCCGIPNGCDLEYNLEQLGAYGIQYWLNYSWLSGFINVGVRRSHTSEEISSIIQSHENVLNYQFRNRFCNNPPDLVYAAYLEMPLGPAWPVYTEEEMHFPALLFPNPVAVDTEFTIRTSGVNEVSIISIDGIILRELRFEGLEEESIISTQGLKPGFYFVRVKADQDNHFLRSLVIK